MSHSWDSIARRYVEHDTLPQETFGELTVDAARLTAVGERIAETQRAANDNLRPVAPTAATVRKGDFMQTFTARQFWPLDARTAEVHIEDIAHSLSL